MGLQVPSKVRRFFKSWFSSGRIQENLLLTNDGRLLVRDIEVEKGYEVDDDLQMAWGLDSSNQIRNTHSKNLTQVICEYDAAPVAISGQSGLNLSGARGAIALRSFWDKVHQIERNSKRNLLIWGLIVIAGVAVIGVVGMMWWARVHGG